jgi:3-dehydroquinate synthase
MSSRTIRIDVDLGPRSYPVLIGHGILTDLGSTLREHGFKEREAFVITNSQVGGLYFDAAAESLRAAEFAEIVRHDIPVTEDGKSWDELSKTCAALLSSFPAAGHVPLVLLLGGGVIGDLGGFAAGVFRRGVPFVQIPTSLLAMVDSSVGGKVGVNFGGVKNILGMFNQPRLVFADLATLKTLKELGPREIRSGCAEIIKYGAVCSAQLFEQLENGGLQKVLEDDPQTSSDIVAECVRLKAEVVQQDEFDKRGIRNVLNFGHTVGHALELAVDGALAHGEAISVGMIAATHIAKELKVCEETFEARLKALLGSANLPIDPDTLRKLCKDKLPQNLFDRVLANMNHDKKFQRGRNLFVLPTRVGAWEPRENVPWEIVHTAIRRVLPPT